MLDIRFGDGVCDWLGLTFQKQFQHFVYKGWERAHIDYLNEYAVRMMISKEVRLHSEVIH